MTEILKLTPENTKVKKKENKYIQALVRAAQPPFPATGNARHTPNNTNYTSKGIYHFT